MFTGRDKYQRNLKLLVPFFEEPLLTLYNIEDQVLTFLFQLSVYASKKSWQQISNLTSKYGAGYERRQQINWSTMEFEVCHCGFSLVYVEILLSNVIDKWIWWLGHSARTYPRLPWKPLIEVDGSMSSMLSLRQAPTQRHKLDLSKQPRHPLWMFWL